MNIRPLNLDRLRSEPYLLGYILRRSLLPLYWHCSVLSGSGTKRCASTKYTYQARLLRDWLAQRKRDNCRACDACESDSVHTDCYDWVRVVYGEEASYWHLEIDDVLGWGMCIRTVVGIAVGSGASKRNNTCLIVSLKRVRTRGALWWERRSTMYRRPMLVTRKSAKYYCSSLKHYRSVCRGVNWMPCTPQCWLPIQCPFRWLFLLSSPTLRKVLNPSVTVPYTGRKIVRRKSVRSNNMIMVIVMIKSSFF